MTEPWYVEAFRAEYLDVYAHRDLESARREARYLVDHGIAGTVLDLCCGSGRHVAALREQGVRAFGLDLSRELLRRAQESPARLVCGDARRIPVLDGRLDAVVSLFSSFGYFGDEEDQAVVAGIARVLRPAGSLVLDLMNPSHVRATLVPNSVRERSGVRIEERRRLEDEGRRVVKLVRRIAADGSERTWREDVRLYDLETLEPLLARSGLSIGEVHGGFDASPLSRDSPRLIVWARRR